MVIKNYNRYIFLAESIAKLATFLRYSRHTRNLNHLKLPSPSSLCPPPIHICPPSHSHLNHSPTIIPTPSAMFTYNQPLRPPPPPMLQQHQLSFIECTHRVISDKEHRLLVTLSYFRPDRFVQLLSLIPILILILYLLVSIDLMYTNLCELVSRRRTTVF